MTAKKRLISTKYSKLKRKSHIKHYFRLLKNLNFNQTMLSKLLLLKILIELFRKAPNQEIKTSKKF